MRKFGWTDGFLSLNHTRMAKGIWTKFGREIDIDLGEHTGYILSQYYIPVGHFSTTKVMVKAGDVII